VSKTIKVIGKVPLFSLSLGACGKTGARHMATRFLAERFSSSDLKKYGQSGFFGSKYIKKFINEEEAVLYSFLRQMNHLGIHEDMNVDQDAT
jgi:hypothetical protein